MLYTLVDQHLLLDASEKQYILKFRDLPTEDRPRERLIAHGPESLSSAELLAVILTTGTQKEDVLTMSQRILKEYGDKGVLSQTNANKLSEDLHIPLGKATQIIASAELGRRFFTKNEASAPIIRTAKEVYEHVREMTSLSKEHLRGIYLNSHYKMIHEEVISIGTVDANMVHPREVFKPALDYSAAAVILIHNHPSGDVTPSLADIEVTKQLVQAGKLLGIELIDHLIVTKTSYISIPNQYS